MVKKPKQPAETAELRKQIESIVGYEIDPGVERISGIQLRPNQNQVQIEFVGLGRQTVLPEAGGFSGSRAAEAHRTASRRGTAKITATGKLCCLMSR